MKNFLLLLCLCLSGIGFAQNQVEFRKFKLDNGLTVILHEDKTTPNVIVSVMYHVGSKNENPDRTGFAHFFEHLLFEGSENLERGQFDNYVEEAGGTLNANTSFDRTFYYEILPSNHLETALWLESERMLHAKVEDIGIETQREVVKEERRQRMDNQPYGSLLEEILKRSYSQHPYKNTVIGSMAHLEAATEEDYVNFYKTFYVPNNAILSIAGNIDYSDAKDAVEKYFGSIPMGTGAIPRPSIVEPELGREIRDTIFDNIQLPAVVQAYRIPAQGTEDYYAVQMLSQLLSGGKSARMAKKLVDEDQLALQVVNFPFSMEDPGLSLTFGIASIGTDPAILEAGMDAEVDRIHNELIGEREFQKLRNQIEADFITGNASIAGIAESLANYEMYFGDANLINTELERYMNVSPEDIQRVARKYFRPDNRVVLYYLPKPEQP